MQTLVVMPIKEEIKYFLQACTEQEIRTETAFIGKLPVTQLPDLGITVASGGLGKVQFAVQTQHLIDAGPAWDLVICAGAAGALKEGLSAGDVVIGTETVEHDIRSNFGLSRLPRFSSDAAARDAFKKASLKMSSFSVFCGAIASGDENVVDTGRRKQVQKLTGALAVAWEGAGGARACQFSGIPFIEIRAVTDSANSHAIFDFILNLKKAMKNIALLITYWARSSHEI